MPSNTSPTGSESVMKWVTRATAVFALVFAVLQMVRTVVDVRDRRRQIDELKAEETIQRRGNDYARAWATLDQAVKIAESGGLLARLTGQLSTEARDLRIAQEDLAMAWLDNLYLPPGMTMGEVFDRLIPVMTRGAAAAPAGPRKADLLAHIGWARSQQDRDATTGFDPTPQYRDAIAIDAANPYAHAYLGYWLLSSSPRRPLEEGKAEFRAALASGRARDFVRVLQLAGMRSRSSDGDPERVAIINDMRRNHETVDDGTRSELYGIYTQACGYREDAEAMRAIVGAAPPAEQAETVRALLVDPPSTNPTRRPASEACLATLLEAAGDRTGAAVAWQSVRKDAPPGDPNGLLKRADAALRRLAAARSV